MAKREKKSSLPDWLNIKNITMILAMLGFGTGGYFAADKDPEKQVVERKVVESFDVKEFSKSVLEIREMDNMAQKEKDRNQNERIDDLFDEVRQDRKDTKTVLKTIRQDIKDIKVCLENQGLITTNIE